MLPMEVTSLDTCEAQIILGMADAGRPTKTTLENLAKQARKGKISKKSQPIWRPPFCGTQPAFKEHRG